MTVARKKQRRGVLAPDPEMWEAFKGGPRLREVLQDFYTRVYDDERLAPFFKSVTKDWAIGKQYSYLCSIFTGQAVFFGNRPRSAHHWMVISDELFDYREDLMEESLRKYGIPQHLIRRFRAFDEVFRKQIVKDTPRPQRLGDLVLPLDGYEMMEVNMSTLCSLCHREVTLGESVHYHVHTGATYCSGCTPEDVDKESS